MQEHTAEENEVGRSGVCHFLTIRSFDKAMKWSRCKSTGRFAEVGSGAVRGRNVSSRREKNVEEFQTDGSGGFADHTSQQVQKARARNTGNLRRGHQTHYKKRVARKAIR